MATDVNRWTFYAWGFPPDALAWLREIAGARSIAALDATTPVPPWEAETDALVLVYADAATAAAYAAAATAHPLRDGRAPDAALITTDDDLPAPIPADLPITTTVALDDAAALDELFGAPEQFRAAELAEDLPGPFLAALTGRVATLPLEEIPLPDAARALLAAHPAHRAAFDRAADARCWRRRALVAPSIAALAAYVRAGVPDAALDAALARDRVSAAEVAALRQLFPPAPWFAVRWQRIAAGATDTLGILRSLVGGLIAAGVEPQIAFARTAGEPDTAATPTTEQQREVAVASLTHGLGATFAGTRTVRLDYEADTLRFSGLDGVAAFRIELRAGGAMLRDWPSEGGEIEIPMGELTAAFDDGADGLAIIAT